MAESNIRINDDDEGFRTVRLDRAQKLNALTEEMFVTMTNAVDEASENPELRCLIIAGSARAFSAGADIKGYADEGLDAFIRFQRLGRRLNDAVFNAAVPVIAVVEGLALGGGFEIALACDFVVAGSAAQFGLPEVKLGLLPGGGGTQRLPRVVGKAAAKQMLFSGGVIDAQTAFNMGIVSVVAGSPMAHARQMAAEFAMWPRRTLAAIKSVVNEGYTAPLAVGLAMEHQALVSLYQSPEGREGITAFVEKRQPRY